MRLALCGVPDLVGSALGASLTQRGHQVTTVSHWGDLPASCQGGAPDAVLLGAVPEDAGDVAALRSRGTRVILLNPPAGTVPPSVAESVDGFVPGGVTLAELEETLAGVVRPRRTKLPRQRGPSWSPDHHLSPRERQVIRLLVAGKSSSEMADQLHLSVSTVHSHVQSLLRKLGAHDRVDAVSRYLHARAPHDLGAV